MDRRKTIKAILAGSVATGIAVTTGSSCKVEPKDTAKAAEQAGIPSQFSTDGQTPEEQARDVELFAQDNFFDAHETATVAVLADLIIPADETGPSATETGVVDFLDFLMRDVPSYQDKIRGGLKWLDYQCVRQYEGAFKDVPLEKQTAMLDLIAYPNEVKPEHEYGEKFFTLLRNLVTTGYFTSKAGIEDLGYIGNYPNIWAGVPEDVLQKHGMNYEDKWKEVYLRSEEREQLAEWDEDGNLLRS